MNKSENQSDNPRRISRKPLSPARALWAGALLIAAVFVVAFLTYRSILSSAGVEEAENFTTYERHIAMVVDDGDEEFWRDVYENMQRAANQRDAYVELKGFERASSSYSLIDWMDIAIASGVDGIVVQNTAIRGLEDKIREAAADGIPVVTVLNDAPQTDRVSYIGVNPYTIGQAYSEELLSLIGEGDEEVRIAVLLTDEATDRNQYQIYSQINTVLVTDEKTSGRAQVTAVRVPSGGAFESEEVIRSLFQSAENAPDFVVCFSSLVTDSVYQTVIDYNLAGKVQIIGYYLSPSTRSAILSGNIAATMILDTAEMGEACANALLDQIEEGRTNSYFGTDMRFLTEEDLRDE